MLNEKELTGRACTHVVQLDELGAGLHRAVVGPFLAMKDAAAREGIAIEIVSAFRDFEAQAGIWNRKFRGERPLYDAHGNVRDHAALPEDELIDAIICWSAVPGASRHHWGADIDVIDRAAVPGDYRVRLLPDEAQPDGVFGKLHRWLDDNMRRFGFFRPYRDYRGGVHPEPWHLSYAPVSAVALELLTEELVAEAVGAGAILGKERVLARLPELYRRYVINIDQPEFSTRALA
ncbi:MAG: M15 family metallopeptidase [Betaproteobacteria bacterium]|nr:M15 family metallopeptidase [Betaproteobacteria bacterium]